MFNKEFVKQAIKYFNSDEYFQKVQKDRQELFDSLAETVLLLETKAKINIMQQPKNLSQALQRGFKITLIEFSEGRNCLVTVKQADCVMRFTQSAKHIQQEFIRSINKLQS